jgi:hypothetical protein
MHSSSPREWDADEDNQLIARYTAGASEEELAQLLGRHPDDIGLRLWNLLAPKILPALRQLDLE